MNLTKQPPTHSDESISTPANFGRDRLILKDQIQKTYNRIWYDRTLDPDHLRGLEISLEELEKEYQEFFGEG